MIYIYLPVFHDLQLISCNAYLEQRFDKNVKMMGSLVYTIQNVLFIPVVMYVPALALSQGELCSCTFLNERIVNYASHCGM